MDSDQLQSVIYHGRCQAAVKIGELYDLYRPTDLALPLGMPLDQIHAAFNPADPRYTRAGRYGTPMWYAELDGNCAQVGDYLVAADGGDAEGDVGGLSGDGNRWATGGTTYFIAGKQPSLPIVCIECNHAVIVKSRSQPATGTRVFGVQPYSAVCAADEVNVLGGGAGVALSRWGNRWPCAILFGGREQMEQIVPTSTRLTAWMIWLPPSARFDIHAGDEMVDETGRGYTVLGAEWSDLGWRVKAVENHD